MDGAINVGNITGSHGISIGNETRPKPRVYVNTYFNPANVSTVKVTEMINEKADIEIVMNSGEAILMRNMPASVAERILHDTNAIPYI